MSISHYAPNDPLPNERDDWETDPEYDWDPDDDADRLNALENDDRDEAARNREWSRSHGSAEDPYWA